MATRSVTLTEAMEEFIASGVAKGRFSDANEAVLEGLGLLAAREDDDKSKLSWLRAAVQEGMDASARNEYTVLRSSQDIEELMETVHLEAVGEIAAKRKRG